jgi:hypothetical protein
MRVNLRARPSLFVLAVLFACLPAWAEAAVDLAPKEVSKPADVTLSIDPAPTEAAKQLDKTTEVTVGGVKVPFKVLGPGKLTFTPPPLESVGDKDVIVTGPTGELVRSTLRYVPPTADAAEARRDRLAQSYWFYGLVTLIFGFLVGVFAFVIYRALNPTSPPTGAPLGLPVGSFRSILAYSLLVYLGFYVLTSILSVSTFAPPEYLLGIVATVIGFYFGSRTGEEAGAGATKTGAVRGHVRKPQGAQGDATGAIIRLKRSADNILMYSRLASTGGRFEISSVVAGKYKIQASLEPHQPSPETEIEVVEGSDQELELTLT